MTVKNWLFFSLGVAVLVFALWVTNDRMRFVREAKHTLGTVRTVTVRNGRCGGSRHSYDCTKFQAIIDFPAGNLHGVLSIDAGQERGWNQPLSFAHNQAGDRVPVAYDPKNPDEAFRDTAWDVWAAPILSLIMAGGLFIGSFVDGRRRRNGTFTAPPPGPQGPADPPPSSGPRITTI